MKLIVAAMQEEAKLIKDCDVIITGVGKVNAAHKLTEALMKHNVTAIYNVGFAGASHHYHIGDMIIIEQVRYHDFDLTFFGYEKGQVPHMPAAFKSDEQLIKKAQSLFPNAKLGELFTGDYFMTKHVDQPYIVDMEGASFYHVAHLKNVPIISIKIVSDIVGMDNHYEQYKSFEQEQGAKEIARIVDLLVKE